MRRVTLYFLLAIAGNVSANSSELKDSLQIIRTSYANEAMSIKAPPQIKIFTPSCVFYTYDNTVSYHQSPYLFVGGDIYSQLIGLLK